VLGRHDGQHNYTVGQRRGLNLSSSEPLYVLKREAETNRVVVGPRSALATNRVRLENATLHRSPDVVQTVRLRYHAEPLACRVHVQDDGSLELELDGLAYGVAPGQLACLMREDRVVGEATIGEPR
jgi:tRNA-uridine 2-sulfurtransferase